MKIAFIFHDAEVYGAPKSLLDLIDGLRQHDSHIICYAIIPCPGPLLEEIKKRNIEYQAICYDRWVHKIYNNPLRRIRAIIRKFPDNRLLRVFKTTKASFKIKKQLNAWKVDIVYTNTSVVAAGAIAAFLSGKKHVWHIREFQETIRLDWGKFIFSYMLKKSSAVIFTSYVLNKYYRHLIKKANDIVVYNGVVGKREFDSIKGSIENSERRSGNSSFTFCIVGLISPEKGQHEAIKALALLVSEGLEVRLLIAGKGDARELIKLIRSLGVENHVQFLGHVDNPFESVYFQSDASLMCSVHEAFGRVTVEAMAAALPVIGKKSMYSGTEELIQDGVTGFLYEGDEAALAEKMKHLVNHPEKGKQLGERGWHFAKDNFNRELYVNTIYKLLKAI